MNARQRRPEIHRRQASVELVRAGVEPASIAQPQPNMVPGGRFNQVSTSVFGTPCISSSVLSGAQSMKQACLDARRPSRLGDDNWPRCGLPLQLEPGAAAIEMLA